MIRGVIEKPKGSGNYYRRFKIERSVKEIADLTARGKKPGKWKDHYVPLPAPDSPNFATELAKVNAKAPERDRPAKGTIGALIAEFRIVLAKTMMAATTREAWRYYLKLIDQEHGTKPVEMLRKSHVYKIRDGMVDTPGKANNYVAKLRGLLEFGVERDWIAVNPAAGVGNLETGEHEPWPAHVLEHVLGEADDMLYLALVSELCSGQRVSDVVRMHHNWINDGMMDCTSLKTKTLAFIPMHPLWKAAIARIPRKAVTILYDRFGKPFSGPDRLQERLRRLMHRLGYVDDEGQLLYTFHGLSKNACCYLAELGLSDTEGAAIVGKTPETFRYYAKNARTLMIAKGAANRVVTGKISGLVGK